MYGKSLKCTNAGKKSIGRCGQQQGMNVKRTENGFE